MKRTYITKRAILSLVATLVLINFGVSTDANSSSSSTNRKLFNGRVTVSLPDAARAPKKVNSKTYQVRPKSPVRKFVIYVTREALRKDEVRKKSNKLAPSIIDLLLAQGYEAIRVRITGDIFTADFRGYATVPWQKVGTSAVRGTAKFTRTRSNELIGTILLCDSRQWTDAATKAFKRVVRTTKVVK